MSDIKVQIHLMGPVDVNIANGDFVAVKAGSNLSDLLTQVGIRAEHKKFVIATVNDKKETLYYMLKNNDEIKLLLPVGGG